MLSFPTPAVYQSSKCFFTYGTMSHLNDRQPPSKGKPWAKFINQGLIHKVDLLLPDECAAIVTAKLQSPQFSRVVLKLEDILDGDFFTQYIKIGNILMLSEGRTGIDNVFSLREGILTMYLDKETYERAGLVGKPHGVKGARGLKPSHPIPTSRFDNVARQEGVRAAVGLHRPDPDPLAKHFPTKITSNAQQESVLATIPELRPSLHLISGGDRIAVEEVASETYEWLSLLRLGSPRVRAGDNVDSHISKYQVPGEPDGHSRTDICKISWQGFIAPAWVQSLLAEALLSLPSKTWFSLSATGFSTGFLGETSDVTFIRPPNSPGEYMLWEVDKRE